MSGVESTCWGVYGHPQSPSWRLHVAAVLGGGCWLLTTAPLWGTVLRSGRCPLTWEAGASLTCITDDRGTLGNRSPVSVLTSKRETASGVYAPESSVCGSNESQTSPGPRLSLALFCSRVPNSRAAVSQTTPPEKSMAPEPLPQALLLANQTLAFPSSSSSFFFPCSYSFLPYFNSSFFYLAALKFKAICG